MSDTAHLSVEPGPEQQAPKPKSKNWARELLETALLSVAIFFAVQAVVQSYLVDGRSMLPSLRPNERVFVNKAAYWRVDDDLPVARGPLTGTGEQYLFDAPARGDVIVFRHPQGTDDLIKRVIGMPGDMVGIRDGRVFLNGRELDEPYLEPGTQTLPTRDTSEPSVRVPAGHFFVMGDNRENSSDSREGWTVPAGNVVGEAMLRYWPLPELGGIPHAAVVPAWQQR